MKRIISTMLVLVILLFCLSSCGCDHVWQEATCVSPRTCSVCGKTEGTPLGHSFSDATCMAPKKCIVCGDTEGLPIEHSYIPANCYFPKECSVCGKTEGQALDHNYVNHVCTLCGSKEQTLEDIGFYDFQGVTEYVKIYGYDLNEGWVKCKSRSRRVYDFNDGVLYSYLIETNGEKKGTGSKYIFNITDNDTIYLPSWLGSLRILERIVISEEKQQVILKCLDDAGLDDSTSNEIWFVSKNAIDFSSREEVREYINGSSFFYPYDKYDLK